MEWVPVKGYEGIYEINRQGQVRRVETGKILKAWIAKNGYWMVSLWRSNKGEFLYVHRLLAIAFLNNPKPDEYLTINHIDGDKTNNDLSNLEWASYGMNNKHAYDLGLKRISEEGRSRIVEATRRKNRGNSYRSKPVIRYSLDGQLIDEYPSAKEAAEKLDLHVATVIRSAKGHVKKPKQWIFKYKEDIKYGN